MVDENERRLILEMIQNGKISADQGLQLLKTLAESDEIPGEEAPELAEGTTPELTSASPELTSASPELTSASPELTSASPEPASASPGLEAVPGAPVETRADTPLPESAAPQTSVAPELPPDARYWRRWWTVPLWIGVGILVLGGWLMYWAQATRGIGFLFFCAWLPFLLGLALVVLAWQSRTGRWLHLRVVQPPGDWPRRIHISFPIPVGLTSWFLRTFRSRIPGLDNSTVDQALTALEQHTSPDNPLFIEVEEGAHGERVQIYIG